MTHIHRATHRATLLLAGLFTALALLPRGATAATYTVSTFVDYTNGAGDSRDVDLGLTSTRRSSNKFQGSVSQLGADPKGSNNRVRIKLT